MESDLQKTNTSTPKIWDLLDWVQQETGRTFLVCNQMDAPPQLTFLYNRSYQEQKGAKYFSNRPFPANKVKQWRNTKNGWKLSCHRLADRNIQTEQFIRIDFELPDHSQTPTPEDRDYCRQWALENDACGCLQTPHGTHAYFMSDKPFPIEQLKPVVLGLISNYRGNYIACDASWSSNNLSRANNNGNYNLEFFQKKQHNNTQKHFLYCGTISKDNKNSVSNSKSSSNNKKNKKRVGGSRQAENEEFKGVWWRLKNGENIDDVCKDLKHHTKADIVSAMQKPEYKIKNVGKVKAKQIGYYGNISDTRCIQRSTTKFANIAHSLSDLRSVSNEKALELIKTNARFKVIYAELKKMQDWEKFVIKLLSTSRERYGVGVGAKWVSDIVLQNALKWLKNADSLTARSLQSYLEKNLPTPATDLALHGSSVRHSKRIITLLVKSGILVRQGAGRSTHYEQQPITELLLEKLSCLNLKQSASSTTRDEVEKEEVEGSMVTCSNTRRVRKETKEDKTARDCRTNIQSEVGLFKNSTRERFDMPDGGNSKRLDKKLSIKEKV